MQAPLDSQAEWYAIVNTMGDSILVETFKLAAYYLTHSNGIHHKTRIYSEARGCYSFIQGTGLDNLIRSYCLDYSSDDIRKGFFYCMRRSC